MKIIVRIVLGIGVLLLIFSITQRWLVYKEVSAGGFFANLIFFIGLTWSILYLLRRREVISSTVYVNSTVLLFSVMIALLISEILLRYFSKNLRSYGERNGAKCYNSPYHTYLHPCDSCNGGYFYINQPFGIDQFSKSEFNYIHSYNSLGLRDHEFSTQKDTNEFRILGIGDSFTEGVGAPADSTWVKQLEYLLNRNSGISHFTTMNAGAHGSDLIFSFDFLTRCLLKYKPDMVILNLNSTDINDIISRGGNERFDATGNFHDKKGPWWEFFFGSSYLVRLITLNVFHFNWQLFTEQEQQLENSKALVEISEKLNSYQAAALNYDFTFLLVVHPLQDELTSGINVLSDLNVSSGITKIDLTKNLQNKIKDKKDLKLYYWPIDGHFTTLGYSLLAETIYQDYFLQRGDSSSRFLQ